MPNKDYNFVLPVGYIDMNGNIHREGKMRQVTAFDEIEIHSDEKLLSAERYHDILLLARVVTEIGSIVLKQ